jgi:hypothetical protein
MGGRSWAAGMAALVCAFTVAGIVPALGESDGNDTLKAAPAAGSSLDPAGSFYLLHAQPGDSFTQTVTISNPNDHQVTARVEGVDGYTAESTGASYSTPGTAPTRDGRWVVVSTPEIALQPGETRDVTFSVHVPEDATPGQHLAGLSMSVPVATPASSVAQGGAGATFAINLQGQRIIAVQIDVAGDAAPKLVVGGVKPEAGGEGVLLRIAIANSGNAFARGKGVVRVPDTKFQQAFDIDTFVSKTEINFPILWTKEVVSGSHRVSVKLTYDGDRVTTWNGTIDIVGETQAKLERDLKNTRPASSSFDWTRLLVIAGLVIAFACALAAYLIHRREGRSVRPARLSAGMSASERA